MVERSCLQETLVQEIFYELAKGKFKSISTGLEKFLRQLARNFATTAINEDTFQRTTSAEDEVPSKLLSGDQAGLDPLGSNTGIIYSVMNPLKMDSPRIL